MSVFVLTLRGLLLRWRTLGLLALTVAVGAVAVLLRLFAGYEHRLDAYGQYTGRLLIPVVIALVALVIGVSAFGDEREEGTMPLLMATPTARWRIVLGKLLAAMLTSFLLVVPAVVGGILLGTGTNLPTGKMVAATVGASAAATVGYTALFLLLSLLVQRGVLVGMGYVVLWEGVFANYASAARSLSIGAYGRRILKAGFEDFKVPFLLPSGTVLTAIIVLTIVTILAYMASSWRLPRVEVR
jgi:ABC-2 type transport system permease protein